MSGQEIRANGGKKFNLGLTNYRVYLVYSKASNREREREEVFKSQQQRESEGTAPSQNRVIEERQL